MGYVFKQSPEKHAANKSQNNPAGGIIQFGATIIKHIHDHRQVHAPDHQWMCFGKHFQVIILEQPGLSFIMNFIELHTTKIT